MQILEEKKIYIGFNLVTDIDKVVGKYIELFLIIVIYLCKTDLLINLLYLPLHLGFFDCHSISCKLKNYNFT